MLKPTISVTTKIVSNNKVMITIHDHKDNTSFQVLLSSQEILDIKQISKVDKAEEPTEKEELTNDGNSAQE